MTAVFDTTYFEEVHKKAKRAEVSKYIPEALIKGGPSQPPTELVILVFVQTKALRLFFCSTIVYLT